MARTTVSRTHRGIHQRLNPTVVLLLVASALPTCAFGATGNVDYYGIVYSSTLLESGATTAQAGLGLANLALFGAHHRSLLDMGITPSEKETCAWATADAAKHDSADFSEGLAEVGVCKDVGSARWGIGVGQAWSRQDRLLGGKTSFDGQYLVAEVANDFRNGMEASVTAFYARFDTKLRRNYTNGAGVDSSIGRPDAESLALRARLDWKNAARLGQFSMSPYAAYTWTKTKLDAYTEIGGSTPQQFAAADSHMNDIRIGVAAKTALSSGTNLRLALAAAHRFDNNTDNVSGPNFNLTNQGSNKNWVHATVDVDHRISNYTALTVGAGASGSNDSDSWGWGVTAGLQTSF